MGLFCGRDNNPESGPRPFFFFSHQATTSFLLTSNFSTQPKTCSLFFFGIREREIPFLFFLFEPEKTKGKDKLIKRSVVLVVVVGLGDGAIIRGVYRRKMVVGYKELLKYTIANHFSKTDFKLK